MREPERNFPTDACAVPVPGSEPFLGLPHVGWKMPSHYGQTQSPGRQGQQTLPVPVGHLCCR